MGMTIHYSLETRAKRPLALTAKIRRQALELPFEEVGELRYFGPDICKHGFAHYRDKDEETYSALVRARMSVDCPWNKHISFDVGADEVYYLPIIVGEGCEWLELGLARHPQTMEVEYREQDDEAYWSTSQSGGFTTWGFDPLKYQRKTGRNWRSADARQSEKRTIKTGLGSKWTWRGFCKTQYAANKSLGGVPNFLRCHLSVISLLKWIRDVLRIQCSINDEGRYERWYGYGKIGDESSVGWHPGHLSVEKLAQEVGEWNEQLAAFCGALKGGAGDHLIAEIQRFPDFEHLEAAGYDADMYAKWKALGKAIKAMANKQR